MPRLFNLFFMLLLPLSVLAQKQQPWPKIKSIDNGEIIFYS